MGWKDYYIAASGCAAASCPTGQKANSAHTGCEAITCPNGQVLQGDDCRPKCAYPSYSYYLGRQVVNTAEIIDGNKYRISLFDSTWIDIPSSIFVSYSPSTWRLKVSVPTKVIFRDILDSRFNYHNPSCTFLYSEATNDADSLNSKHGFTFPTLYKHYYSCPPYTDINMSIPISLVVVSIPGLCFDS